MEAVLDSQWDAGLAIAVVLVIGANYIKCERKTKGSSSARLVLVIGANYIECERNTKVSSSGDGFPRKLRVLWALNCRTRLLAAPLSAEIW